MTIFLSKIYQQSVLDSIVSYFRVCLQQGDADKDKKWDGIEALL